MLYQFSIGKLGLSLEEALMRLMGCRYANAKRLFCCLFWVEKESYLSGVTICRTRREDHHNGRDSVEYDKTCATD